MVGAATYSLTDTAPAPPSTGGRIVGLDVARALAMLGMVIAHYAWSDGSGTLLDGVAAAVDGRAMPLFVMLGGVGAVILTDRSPDPDRSLLIRAAILFPMGLILEEFAPINIILQYYSVLFVAAIVLRHLSSRALAVVAVAVTLAGSWTYQVLEPNFDGYGELSDLIDDPLSLGSTLIFEGNYPFLPTAAFFAVGMIIARTDLRSPAIASWLTAIGGGLSLFVMLTANRLVESLDVDKDDWYSGEGSFELSRLLDDGGHSKMLAWVIGSGGSSLAIIGLCLLLAPRAGAWLRPLVSLGQLALTFYVFQAVVIIFVNDQDETSLSREFLNVLVIYVGFMVFAWLWRQRFRSGPFEALLRIGSRSRQKS